MVFPKRATFSTSLQAKEGVACAGACMCYFFCVLCCLLLAILLELNPPPFCLLSLESLTLVRYPS